MTKILIRHAASADFHALLNIDQASFPQGVAYDSTELAYFMNRPGAETLVLEADGLIAGFLIVEVHRKQSAATMITLDVREEYQRRGCATRLLEKSEEILKDCGIHRYQLQVDVSNEPAIGFYRKHGFRRARLLRNYYAGGNDAYLMVKKL